jgi:hypothetical protein
MRYGPQAMTNMMGIGSYVGEVRRGPDGQVYQWVEGVDGLGNPIGFWRGLKKLASTALPLAKMIPGVGPIIAAVKPFCQTLPQVQPLIQQAPGIQPIYTLGTKICNVLGKVGIAGAEDAIMEAPDGQLYEVVEGIGAPSQARPGRPVWISTPALIRPRRSHLGRRRRRVVKLAARGAQPAVIAPAVPGVQPAVIAPAVPGAQPAVTVPAVQVARQPVIAPAGTVGYFR